MNQKKTLTNALAVALALSPIVFLLLVWKTIPETIAIRINLTEEHVKEESRQVLWVSTVILSVVAATIFLLMRNLKRIDPKVNEHTPVSGFNRLGWLLIIVLTLLNYFLIFTAVYAWEVSEKTLLISTGILFALLGNYMSSIRPNFFAGIRLPWTLNDENNWRLTHQLAGKLWFAGGIVLAVLIWLLPASAMHPVFISGMIVLVLVPGIYSYRLYRNKVKN